MRSYRTATSILEPAVLGLLYWRQRKGREDRTRLGERQGYPSRARPNGHLVWVHGASIGETLSLLPIVERLTQRGLTVLVTSGTRTSAALIARRLPPGAVHQFVPLDVPRYLRRFLDHWQPDLALVAESEIWPNTIVALDQRHIPLVLVNARMSDRSFQRWLKLPRIIGALLQRFAICLAQTQDDAERLAYPGRAARARHGQSEIRFTTAARRSACGRAPVGASRGTTGVVCREHASGRGNRDPRGSSRVVAAPSASSDHHRSAPSAPGRGNRRPSPKSNGLRASQRSQGIHPDRATDVYIADTVGEMGLFYRLSPIVIMGGSLVAHGGQNPIEPAKLGAAILHGPHIHNFEDIYASIGAARGALMVKDSASLARAVSELLSNTALTRDMARAASDAVQALGGAVDRTMQSIEPFIVQAKLGARR